jgi:hypothetical protein
VLAEESAGRRKRAPDAAASMWAGGPAAIQAAGGAAKVGLGVKVAKTKATGEEKAAATKKVKDEVKDGGMAAKAGASAAENTATEDETAVDTAAREAIAEEKVDEKAEAKEADTVKTVTPAADAAPPQVGGGGGGGEGEGEGGSEESSEESSGDGGEGGGADEAKEKEKAPAAVKKKEDHSTGVAAPSQHAVSSNPTGRSTVEPRYPPIELSRDAVWLPDAKDVEGGE